MYERSIRAAMVLAVALAATPAPAQTPASASALIERAAAALGGRSQVLGVRTLSLYGYGENNAQDGGGNISASPHAPQKRTDVDGLVRTLDYPDARMHLTATNVQAFEFALPAMMAPGIRVNQGLDGDIAFNVGGNPFNPSAGAGPVRAPAAQVRTRRIEMLDNPLSIVRAALQPAATFGALHASDGAEAVDLTTTQGDTVTVGFSRRTGLPEWMRWVAPHEVYGELTHTTYFTGYEPLGDGLVLPFGYQTVVDFQNVVESEVYVDKYVVNGLSASETAQLAAPASVRDAPPPQPVMQTIEATQVAPHVWYLHSSANGSSTAFEFADHVTMFEAYGSAQNFEAVLHKIRAVIPGKPVTQLIISHHHLDHTGGLRAAVAEGLTVITNRGSNAQFVRAVTSRPAREFPDLLQTSGRVGSVQIIPVDNKLVLKDATLEVDILRLVDNNHMADSLVAYVPAAHTLSEGDLMDDTWKASWWGNSYPDTVKYWYLQVKEDLPVHGRMHTYAEVIELTKQQTAGAQALCAKARQDGFALPGCPVANTMQKY
ncbi:MAG: MBL fold metallo-hydrolase [Steroidobacteraceae bacterium]